MPSCRYQLSQSISVSHWPNTSGFRRLPRSTNNLLVRLRLVEIDHLNHGAARRPPRTRRIALGAHGNRQDDVGQSHRRRRKVGIGIHDKRYVLHGFHDTRSILARTRQRVGRLYPHHLDGIREPVLDGLEQPVRARMGHEVAAFDGQGEVVVELLGAPFGRREVLARRVTGVDLERVVHEDVAARNVHVAAQGHEVAACKAQGHCRNLLVEREAPLDGTRLGPRVQTRRITDVVGDSNRKSPPPIRASSRAPTRQARRSRSTRLRHAPCRTAPPR